MKAFTIHEPEALPGSASERADKLTLVKEGFSWPALFIPLPWLLYHRMWLVFAAYLAAIAAVEALVIIAGAGNAIGGFGGLAVSVIFAMHANDLRRWTLTRRGHAMKGVVTGRDLDECEYKLFRAWDAGDARPAAKPSIVRPVAAAVQRPAEGPVIGFLEDPAR